MKVINIIGNGPSAGLYLNKERQGMNYVCNLPPFGLNRVKYHFMVDFKMMKAITEGSVTVPGEWILGARPQLWMRKYHSVYLKHAHQIKEFYTDIPSYANNHTDFNCGHLATYYALKKGGATSIHMFGFDSMFKMELRSSTDTYLVSDRSDENNKRLTGNWRPIWEKMFKEHKDVKFFLHYHDDNITFDIPSNVSIVTYARKNKSKKS
jgi:hypothetical protein